MEKQKNLFDNHGPLCFVHLFVKSQLTFLQVKISVSSHHRRQLLNTSEVLGNGEEKQNLCSGSAKPRLEEYWSPPYTFIQICTFFFLFILETNIFAFVHPSAFAHLTPKGKSVRNFHHHLTARLTSAQCRV